MCETYLHILFYYKIFLLLFNFAEFSIKKILNFCLLFTGLNKSANKL
jgi:hypothetical protein